MKTLLSIFTFALIVNAAFAQTDSNKSGFKMTVNQLQSSKATTIGIHISRFHQPVNGGWGAGFVAQYDIIKFSDEFKYDLEKLYPGFNSYQYIDFSAGADFLYKMFWKIYFVSPVYLHAGGERIETSGEYGVMENFFVGVSGDAMLMFIPDNFGLTFGCGLSGKYNTASVYQTDLGFKIEVGLKF
jgi:hypothetical protein